MDVPFGERVVEVGVVVCVQGGHGRSERTVAVANGILLAHTGLINETLPSRSVSSLVLAFRFGTDSNVQKACHVGPWIGPS